MRDYAKVTGTFWTGKTGKGLKAQGPEAVIVGMYLMTSPHSNMLGLYYLPMLYLAHESGLGLEGALKGLRGAIEAGFCSYDEASEMVWVHEMAFYQISSELKDTDNRCVGIQKEYNALPECPFLALFFEKYSAPFCMTLARGLVAPLKPRARTGARTGAKARAGIASAAKLPQCPADAIVSLYHAALPELPKVKLVTRDRTRGLSDFWQFVLTSKKSDGSTRADDAEGALAWTKAFFERARGNDFLMGRTERGGAHKDWQCTLDFLLSEKGRVQVIEKTKDAA